VNGKQRARWLSDVISELQRYVKHADVEEPLILQALTKLDEARRAARGAGET
jgi:hypothetical protein